MRTILCAGFLMVVILGLLGCNSDGQTITGKKVLPLSHGMLISSYTSGGIAGFNDTIQVSGNWQLIATGRGKNWVRPLDGGEQKQVREILQHFGTMNTSHDDGPNVADGMFTSLVAQGSGSGQAGEKEITALRELLAKLVAAKG